MIFASIEIVVKYGQVLDWADPPVTKRLLPSALTGWEPMGAKFMNWKRLFYIFLVIIATAIIISIPFIVVQMTYEHKQSMVFHYQCYSAGTKIYDGYLNGNGRDVETNQIVNLVDDCISVRVR